MTWIDNMPKQFKILSIDGGVGIKTYKVYPVI